MREGRGSEVDSAAGTCVDIYIITAGSNHAIAANVKTALRSQWPSARVLWLPAGISGHLNVSSPPYLAILLHDYASTETPADILAIRQASGCPIIVMSPGIPEPVEIEWLHLGADVVIGQLSMERLVAILEALMRRARGAGPPEGQLSIVGDLRLDLGQYTLSVEGTPVNITPTEFRVLETLAASFCRCVPSSVLMETVWGLEDDAVRKSLKVHVSRLRKKMADADSTWTVNGVRRNGYMLVECE